MAVAKRQRRENPENKTKEGPRTRVRTSGKTNTPPTLQNEEFIFF